MTGNENKPLTSAAIEEEGNRSSEGTACEEHDRPRSIGPVEVRISFG
jgi:hypothetical protein